MYPSEGGYLLQCRRVYMTGLGGKASQLTAFQYGFEDFISRYTTFVIKLVPFLSFFINAESSTVSACAPL